MTLAIYFLQNGILFTIIVLLCYSFIIIIIKFDYSFIIIIIIKFERSYP